jgi:hypothetical protein
MTTDDVIERAENAIESMIDDVEPGHPRWTLPAGQNAIVTSPTGHLLFVHESELRGWLETMTKAAEALRAERATVERLRAGLSALRDRFRDEDYRSMCIIDEAMRDAAEESGKGGAQ